MEGAINILITSGGNEECEHIIAELSNQKNFHIAGVEKDETNTIIKSERLKPDVLILNLKPPEMDGAELAPIIRRRSPDTSIIMMCDKDDIDYAALALRAGISGFMLRKADMNKLIPAVKIVSLGGYYVSASITARALDTITLMKQFPGQIIDTKKERHAHSKFNLPFSAAECSIITDIAQGLSDEEIVGHLHFSTGTIRNYLAAIKRKTKLNNRTQIVLYSLIHGLISLEQLEIYKNK